MAAFTPINSDENAAVRSLTKVPPALLEEVSKKGLSAFDSTANVMYVNHLNRMYHLASLPDAPNTLRLAVLEHLAKTVGAHAKAAAALNGPTTPAFSITFIGAPPGSVDLKPAPRAVSQAAMADIIDMETADK